jgi:glycosyltransferase involved in cell wall biosynthesis
MITHEPFPPDIRIEKEVNSLRKLGHEVIIFAPQNRTDVPSELRFTIVNSDESMNPRGVLSGRLRKVLGASNLDIIHIQDTPGALSALICARLLGLPVFYDIHELWTHLVLENNSAPSCRKMSWWLNLILDEGATCCNADRILTVVEEASSFFIRKYRIAPGRVVTLRNFESSERFEGVMPDSEVAEGRKYNITYVGGIDGPIRGLENVLYAAKILSRREVRFNIIGAGTHLSALQRLAWRLGLTESVRFTGWMEFEHAMGIVAASDLCLLPHISCVSTENTLPHKISQYLALGKPVISSDLRPIRRLFSGAYIPWIPYTPRRLAEMIEELFREPEEAKPFAKKGYELFNQRYQWVGEERKLFKLYETLE